MAQDIVGLEAAYRAVYSRSLRDRVQELLEQYGDGADAVFSEISPPNQPGKPVPCTYTITELGAYFGSEA